MKAQAPDQPGSVILAKEPVLQVRFTSAIADADQTHKRATRLGQYVGAWNSVAIYFWQANFARAVASLSKAQAKKVARFLPNPERHWGPKVRAGRQITSKHVSLLGPEAVNGHLNHENGEDSEAKRQKTEEREASMWISTECSWSCFIVLNLSWRVSHGQNMFSTDRRHTVIPPSNEISKCHWSWQLWLKCCAN